MSIAKFARLEKMPHGAQREIAREFSNMGFKVSDSDVSKVMNERDSDISPEKRKLIRKAIARRVKMSYAECWPDGL